MEKKRMEDAEKAKLARCKYYKTISFIIDTVLTIGIGLLIIAVSVTRKKVL